MTRGADRSRCFIGPLYGAAQTPATLLGPSGGKKIVGRISDRVFVLLVEIGLLAVDALFLIGL